MLTMSESYDKVQLSWTVKISDSAKKLYYAVHHHHWTSPQHVPNAAQFVSSSNRTNMSYWEPLRRLKWRSVNQRYRTTFRDLTRSTYHAFEIAIGTRSDFKRGMPCLKNLSEVVYTGHHSEFVLGTMFTNVYIRIFMFACKLALHFQLQ